MQAIPMVVLTGGEYSGRSTCLSYLKSCLSNYAYVLQALNPRPLVLPNLEKYNQRDHSHWHFEQVGHYLREQLAAEAAAQIAAQALGARVILCEGGIADIATYLYHGKIGAMLVEYQDILKCSTRRQLLSRYASVLYLESMATSDPEGFGGLYPYCKQALSTDSAGKEAWSQHPHFQFIPYLPDRTKEREAYSRIHTITFSPPPVIFSNEEEEEVEPIIKVPLPPPSWNKLGKRIIPLSLQRKNLETWLPGCCIQNPPARTNTANRGCCWMYLPKIRYLGKLFGIEDCYGSGYPLLVKSVLATAAKWHLYDYLGTDLPSFDRQTFRLEPQTRERLINLEVTVPGDALLLPVFPGTFCPELPAEQSLKIALAGNFLPLGIIQTISLIITQLAMKQPGLPTTVQSIADQIDCSHQPDEEKRQWWYITQYRTFEGHFFLESNPIVCPGNGHGALVALLL